MSNSPTDFELEAEICFALYSWFSSNTLVPTPKKTIIILLKYGKLNIHFDIVRGNKKGWKINNKMSMYTCNPGLNLRAVLLRSWMASVCNLINGCCNTSGEALKHIVLCWLLSSITVNKSYNAIIVTEINLA